MIPTKRILAGSAVLVLAMLSCNSLIDDPDGPNVVLEAENLIIPPVTAEIDPLNPGSCIFTITQSTATFKNKPKNEPAATAPYQDISLFRLIVEYTWDPSLPPLAAREFGIGGAVPANGTAPAFFPVIDPIDLAAYQGAVAALTLTFSGRVTSGETVTFRTGGFLLIESCQ